MLMPLVDRLCFQGSEANGFHEALTAFHSGDVEAALICIKELLSESPNDPYALVLAADCFNHYGKPLEALSLVKTAASGSASCLDFLIVEVCQLNTMGRYADGLFCLELASSLWNQNPYWIWQLILQLELTNRCIEAVKFLNLHIDNLKSQIDFYPIASRLFSGVGQNEFALGLLVEWNTSYPSRDSAKSLADCYFLLNRHDKYVEVLKEASKSYPDDFNLEVLALQAQCDQSIKNVPGVLRLISGMVDSSVKSHEYAFFSGRLLLAQSRFEDGWPLYEHRLLMDINGLYASVRPELDYEKSVQGKSVLLVAEQGVGDVLLFARFIPFLQRDADHVVLLVDNRLLPLMQRCFNEVVVVSDLALAQQLVGDNSIVLAIASLGARYLRLCSSFEDLKVSNLIVPHPLLINQWSNVLPANRMQVGLSLSAGTHQGSYKTQKRSVPVSVVDNAMNSDDFDVHDLQHFGDIEPRLGSFKCIKHSRITHDLDQLIALISRLDILVTSDQTNAFLGGILGVPTIVIAPPNPHFALMSEGKFTPWFESVRLLRCTFWMGWDQLTDPFDSLFSELLSQVALE